MVVERVMVVVDELTPKKNFGFLNCSIVKKVYGEQKLLLMYFGCFLFKEKLLITFNMEK